MVDDEDGIIDEIRARNFTLRKEFKDLGKRSNHSNVAMILREIDSTMQKYSSCFEKGFKDAPPTIHKTDIGISSFRSVKIPDPESLQSVLLYVSGRLQDEVNHVRKISENINSGCINSYIDAIESLRIDVEHLYHNLVEKQL
ncbi:MAG: hypothetical protein M1375_03735 [Candidatus Thermoplasmatota archaeon]|jgi:hypothetical protein|nr:hypothetical protein [Candidatus Thermoplasmatota archaeon]MCL5791064.1 hypothetical protein [Candidatus Thermoplasmatota archaeon]